MKRIYRVSVNVLFTQNIDKRVNYMVTVSTNNYLELFEKIEQCLQQANDLPAMHNRFENLQQSYINSIDLENATMIE